MYFLMNSAPILRAPVPDNACAVTTSRLNRGNHTLVFKAPYKSPNKSSAAALLKPSCPSMGLYSLLNSADLVIISSA
jgi:hypothetical protein